jgi:pyrroline-5-carboxylate reductase
MPLKGLKIGFLGAGVMAEALISGVLKAGLISPAGILISDINHGRLEDLKRKYLIKTAADNQALVEEADLVILAVKPPVVAPLLKGTAPVWGPEKILISIAAGITTGTIEACLERPVQVIRVMPNTPCLVGEGASAVCAGARASGDSVSMAMAIFTAVGKAVEVPELLLDCVTGLSGSGPGYMYLILEGFIDGAVRLGLPRDAARLLITQTMLGAAKMVLETGEHPAVLKDMVTTPGGTTIAGLVTLEEGALRALLIKAVADATRRSRELSEK